jgi:broad specificity phosphatase PhoE
MADFWLRIFLVRHGHVSYFDEDNQPVNPKYAQLSHKGISQIKLLAENLKNLQFESVYSSTMPRSIQTAKILTQHHKPKDILADDAIREIKSGRLRDLHIDKSEQELKNAYLFKTNDLTNFLQGENWEVFSSRVTDWFEQIVLSKSKKQNILISSHDAVNRVLISWMYDNNLTDVYTQEQDYGCLNILDIQIRNNSIFRKRIKLQNFTTYDFLKKDLFNSAMDEVYEAYTKNNGFKE